MCQLEAQRAAVLKTFSAVICLLADGPHKRARPSANFVYNESTFLHIARADDVSG